jgi:class 3 adenylate cyclase
MDASLLEQRLQALRVYSALSETAVSILGEYIRNASDIQLFRINPITFGAIHGLSEQEAIDLFIHSAKVGLFDFSYNLLCLACGGVTHTHYQLDEINNEDFYCALCNMHLPTAIDDQVEVSFTINPSIKKLGLTPSANLESYFAYHFSENIQKAPELISVRNSLIKGYVFIEPDQYENITVNSQEYPSFQLVSIEKNSSCFIYFDKGEGKLREKPETLEINIHPKGLAPGQIHVANGVYSIRINNLTKFGVGILLITPDLEKIMAVVEKRPNVIKPFFTAKMLLNNQSFRELFRLQQLSENLNLNIQSLTILFTDLKGSTDMFDKAGDIYAHEIIQEHFKVLTDSVRKRSGAVIKTMGDAIMASFSSPLEGFNAALDMLQAINQLNHKIKDSNYKLGIKIGINSGPALAVLADERLDYFGQSVNIAARVQALADEGEIWITDSVFQTPNIDHYILEQGYSYQKRYARLKGVGQEATVYKIFKN